MINKTVTFIITDREDRNFINDIYTCQNIMTYGNGIVLHEAHYLINILNHMKEGFTFRVLIHAGLKDNTKSSKGIIFLKQLAEEFNTKDFKLITRNDDLFPNDEEHVIYKGYSLYNADNINTKEFINSLKIINLSEIRENNNQTKSLDKIEEYNVKDITTNPKFAILTGLLEDEYTKFTEMMVGDDKGDFFLGKIKDLTENDYQDDFCVITQDKMGMVDAAITTQSIYSDLNPDVVVLSGVCGGRENKVKKYDIIIPENVIDIITGKYENHKFIPYGYNEDVNLKLIKHIKKITSKTDFIKKEMLNLIPTTSKFKREREIVSNLKIKYGSLACGSFVLKTDDFLETSAKNINDKITGFEMEGYGLMRASKLVEGEKLSLIVKSVMDYTDSKKGDVQDEINDKDNIPKDENIKEMAAYMSFICTRALLPHINNFLETNKT